MILIKKSFTFPQYHWSHQRTSLPVSVSSVKWVARGKWSIRAVMKHSSPFQSWERYFWDQRKEKRRDRRNICYRLTMKSCSLRITVSVFFWFSFGIFSEPVRGSSVSFRFFGKCFLLFFTFYILEFKFLSNKYFWNPQNLHFQKVGIKNRTSIRIKDFLECLV